MSEEEQRDNEIIRRAAEFIAEHEGCLLCAYPDPASPLGRAIGQRGIDRIGHGAHVPEDYKHLSGDPWTIGFGQTKGIKYGMKWDEAQASANLKVECLARWNAIKKLVTAPLAIPQAVALISFVYNLGIGAFTDSTLRRMINAGMYSAAGLEFGKWVNAGGRRMEGLVRRRAAESAVFLSALKAEPQVSAADELARILGR